MQAVTRTNFLSGTFPKKYFWARSAHKNFGADFLKNGPFYHGGILGKSRPFYQNVDLFSTKKRKITHFFPLPTLANNIFGLFWLGWTRPWLRAWLHAERKQACILNWSLPCAWQNNSEVLFSALHEWHGAYARVHSPSVIPLCCPSHIWWWVHTYLKDCL
jgi:hypothetical protein